MALLDGSFYGEQVVALMDHLEIEQAVVMGTSLGANAALEIASPAPERLRGLVIEMPVLDNGLLGSALASRRCSSRSRSASR